MELDEFKELYNSSTDKITLPAQNMMEIMHHKSLGPLAQLQGKTKPMLIIIPLFIALYAGLTISVLGWSAYVHNFGFLAGLLLILPEYPVSLLNYYTIKKLQKPGGNIKENLLNKVTLLKKRYKWYLIINAILITLIPLFIELDIHFHWDGEFIGLGNKINIFIRIAWYIIVFGCMLVIKSKYQKQAYDVHLDQLSDILKQTE